MPITPKTGSLFHAETHRRAIERLGAKLDGILRNHQKDRHGLMRDTCVYSITPAEWPTVRKSLEWRLAER